ncbi:hypothetical protein D3C80_1833100 [compost metagenome]
MKLIEINIVGLQSAQAVMHRRFDIGFGCIPRPAFLAGNPPVADLSGQNDVTAAAAYGVAYNLLIAARIIQIGCIKEVDPLIQRLVDDG